MILTYLLTWLTIELCHGGQLRFWLQGKLYGHNWHIPLIKEKSNVRISNMVRDFCMYVYIWGEWSYFDLHVSASLLAVICCCCDPCSAAIIATSFRAPVNSFSWKDEIEPLCWSIISFAETSLYHAYTYKWMLENTSNDASGKIHSYNECINTNIVSFWATSIFSFKFVSSATLRAAAWEASLYCNSWVEE